LPGFCEIGAICGYPTCDIFSTHSFNDEDLSFLTADRKLVIMTQRALESDRIYLWSELAGTGPPA